METQQKTKTVSKPRLNQKQLQACVIVALFLVLIAYSLFAGITRHKLKNDFTETRILVASELEQDMNMFVRTYDSIAISSEKMETDLLPKLKQYHYSMVQLDNVLKKSFGPRYCVLNDVLRSKLTAALSAYDEAFRMQKNTTSAYESLTEAVSMLNNVRSSRYTKDGTLKPSK